MLAYNPNWSTATQLPLGPVPLPVPGLEFHDRHRVPRPDRGSGHGAYPVDNLLLQSIGLPTDCRFNFGALLRLTPTRRFH